MDQLSHAQTCFLHLERAAGPMHLTTVSVYDQSGLAAGPLRFKQIIRHVEQRVFTLPRFRCRLQEVVLGLDRPYWIEDAQFNLEYHLRHIALPAPGDWRQFCIQIARLHAIPLDLRKPPWEMYVIGGLDRISGVPAGAFAIVSKLHMSLFDSSSRDLVHALHDASDRPFQVSADLQWHSEPAPSQIDLLRMAFLNSLRRPLASLPHLPKRIATVASLLSPRGGLLPGLASASRAAPGTRFNDETSQFRVFDRVNFRLPRFNALKKTLPQVTTNDIVLATCAGTLRAYLAGKGELPAKTLHAATYFNTRTRRSLSPDRDRLELYRVPLFTNIEDPIECLLAIHQQTNQLVKDRPDKDLLRRITDGTALPAPAIALGSRLLTQWPHRDGSLGKNRKVPVNCLITNVPGPQYPLYLCGARLHERTMASPIASGLGLVFNVSSYDHCISISFSSCREMLPDPARFAACIKDSHQTLLSASRKLGAQGTSRRRRLRPPAPKRAA